MCGLGMAMLRTYQSPHITQWAFWNVKCNYKKAACFSEALLLDCET